MRLLRSTFTLSLCFVALSTYGRQRTETEMFSAARAAIEKIVAKEQANVTDAPSHAANRDQKLEVLREDNALSVIGYEDGGFAVVSNDDLMPAVLGYSATSYDPLNANLMWWLNMADYNCKTMIENGHKRYVIAPDPDLYESEMDAQCTSRWDQEAPYWNMCPEGTNDYRTSSGTCLTGCVATGMAQVMYYHRCPAQGQGGTHSVNVDQYGGGYLKFEVNFDESVYDWDNMLDIYTTGNYTVEQADAVALLMRDCGVASDMDYGTDGSGTYMSNCTDGLIRNFGFTEAVDNERNYFTEDNWMDLVYTHLNEHGPIIYAGDDMTYRAGHCFVLDGYDANGYVHINWGWGGSSDGYFDIAILNGGGYRFSSYQEAVTGVYGESTKITIRHDTLNVVEPGTLASLIDDSLLVQAYRVTVMGDINAQDIAALRNLARVSGCRSIDLRQAPIVEGTLADSAFALCPNLCKLVLPRGIKKIGAKAFAEDSRLRELRVYDRDVPTLGSGVFNGMKLSNAYLYVPAATKEKYKRAAQWRNFGDGNTDYIVEFGSAFTVRNCIREQGQPNPTFQYVLNGNAVDGEPEIHCDATEESPVGTYPITLTRGTIENQDVDLVDGYMIIVEATQGIEAVTVDAEGAEAIYNLNGQRINASRESLPAGVYIIGGRKVVL